MIENYKPKLSWVLDAAAASYSPSAVVGVNVHEKLTIAWLEKNGFMKGPSIKNWNHGGRETCLYFKQITKARFNNNA